MLFEIKCYWVDRLDSIPFNIQIKIKQKLEFRLY